MEPHEAITLLSRPHVVLQGRDSEKVFRLAESLKEFLGERAADFVRQHRQDPLLEVFMSDGTPMSVARRFFTQIDGERIRRLGKTSREFLMQFAFVMSSDRVCMPIIKDPVLMQDKTAWTHHRCQADFWQTCRMAGQNR